MHVVLRGNRFLNNCRLCSNWCSCILHGCYGGGVYVQRSNLNIRGSSSFIGNSASVSGGGLYEQVSSNVYISGNTTFSGNSASVSGGGVSVHAM